MNKQIASFLGGFTCGVLLLGGLLFVKGLGEGIKAWDSIDVHSDAPARRMIMDSGIHLPPASWNLFYAISGFQDHSVWITLTVAPEETWEVVENSIQKTRADFTNGIPDSFLDRVFVDEGQEVNTNLWTPRETKHPRHCSIRGKHAYMEDWVVDEELGRIFVTKGSD